MTAFENFFDELDEIETLIDNGLALNESASAFLAKLHAKTEQLAVTANALTVEDVDAEFTEEGDDSDGEEES